MTKNVLKKTLKPVSREYNSMTDYKEDFTQKCIEKSKTLKTDKHGLEREFVNMCKFKTKNSNDIKYSLLIKANETIDRNEGLKQLLKYVKLEHIAGQMEKGLFEFALIHITVNDLQEHYVVNVYNDKLYDLCLNLDVNNEHINNKTLLPTIISDSFDPYFIAFFAPEQLHPKRWMDIITRQQAREQTVDQLQTTDLYKCAKCGERKFKITEMQMRSADEPCSKICLCMVCYHTFIK